MEAVTISTPEQRAHLDAINRHLRSLEEKLHNDILEIWQHLNQAIESGMDVFHKYLITGQPIFMLDPEDIPDEICDKFTDLDDCIIEVVFEGTDKRRIQQDYEHCSRYDRPYFEHPEDYPENYFPRCRSFEDLIRSNLIMGQFSIEDLMYVKVDDLSTCINIHIM